MTLSSEYNKIFIDQKISTSFPDVCVHKGLASSVGLSGRTIPAFVSDWLVSRYSDNKGGVNSEGIRQFVSKYLPDKKQKESLMYELRNGNSLKILDSFSVKVHPRTGELLLRVPCLDIVGGILELIVDEHPSLLMGNVWGSGTLEWRPLRDKKEQFQVFMTAFNPMQAASINLDYFLNQRKKFSLEEWLILLTRTMGYEEQNYSLRQKVLIFTRLIPLVEPRVNIIELAPKGTGKSYVYSQLSRHAWLISPKTSVK